MQSGLGQRAGDKTAATKQQRILTTLAIDMVAAFRSVLVIPPTFLADYIL